MNPLLRSHRNNTAIRTETDTPDLDGGKKKLAKLQSPITVETPECMQCDSLVSVETPKPSCSQQRAQQTSLTLPDPPLWRIFPILPKAQKLTAPEYQTNVTDTIRKPQITTEEEDTQVRQYQEQGAIPGDGNQPKEIPGTREDPDRVLVSDLPNRSKRDRVAPIKTLATQQRSSHRVSQSLLACVPCFAAVSFCQFSWFMRLLCDGISTQPSVRCSMLLADDTKTVEDLGPHTHIEKSTNKANT